MSLLIGIDVNKDTLLVDDMVVMVQLLDAASQVAPMVAATTYTMVIVRRHCVTKENKL